MWYVILDGITKTISVANGYYESRLVMRVRTLTYKRANHESI